MPEPISIASSVIALTTFAFTCSISLYSSVHSFQSNKKQIRDLKDELEALKNVLDSLKALASRDEAQFEILRVPLHTCGITCIEFEAIIESSTAHSNESRTSFRDWARLKYRHRDIVYFKDLLANYKSTIMIAIGDINLRMSAVSASALHEFKDLLSNTTTDLHECLQNLERMRFNEEQEHIENSAKRESIIQEIGSIKQCLAVCTEAAKNASQPRTNVFEDVSAAKSANQVIFSTFGDLISAKKVVAGEGAVQWLGQMSDASLQQMIQSLGNDFSGGAGAVKDTKMQKKRIFGFEDLYGGRHKLG